mmetsp:Transcript_31963/g.99018  ORF Transcript_31963/g.99018 Transcript_31963/m.99018 type:complete len:209 (+) Transcript_31963:737-1363(+)
MTSFMCAKRERTVPMSFDSMPSSETMNTSSGSGNAPSPWPDVISGGCGGAATGLASQSFHTSASVCPSVPVDAPAVATAPAASVLRSARNEAPCTSRTTLSALTGSWNMPVWLMSGSARITSRWSLWLFDLGTVRRWKMGVEPLIATSSRKMRRRKTFKTRMSWSLSRRPPYTASSKMPRSVVQSTLELVTVAVMMSAAERRSAGVNS